MYKDIDEQVEEHLRTIAGLRIESQKEVVAFREVICGNSCKDIGICTRVRGIDAQRQGQNAENAEIA